MGERRNQAIERLERQRSGIKQLLVLLVMILQMANLAVGVQTDYALAISFICVVSLSLSLYALLKDRQLQATEKQLVQAVLAQSHRIQRLEEQLQGASRATLPVQELTEANQAKPAPSSESAGAEDLELLDLSESGPESRSDERVAAAIPVQFRTPSEFVMEYTENISRGGIFIQTQNPPAVGSQFDLALGLPGMLQSIYVRGQVAFAVPPEVAAAQSKVPGVGVRLVNLTAEDGERIARYVATIQENKRGEVMIVGTKATQNRDLLRCLHEDGFEVVPVFDESELNELLGEQPTDVVISALGPQTIPLAARMRQTPSLQKTRVVGLFDQIDDGLVERARTNKVHLLQLPINPGQVRGLLSEFLPVQ